MRLLAPTVFLALFALAAPVTAVSVTPVLAHGPTPQKVDQSVTIAAKPEAVWKVVGTFAAIDTWHPDVAKSEAVDGNAAGGRRKVTLKNGGTLDEGLDEMNDKTFTYSYRLSDADLKALPVSSYSATVTVTPDGAGSKVAWLGRFYRGDTGNEPPEELSDAAGKAAMNAYFANGLKGLKAKVEGGGTK